jgi:hypothetical protein
MLPNHPSTARAPARRPTDSGTEGLPGPLIPALVSLGITVGGIALLFYAPSEGSLVMAVIAMFVAFAFLMAWIGFMLNDHDAP